MNLSHFLNIVTAMVMMPIALALIFSVVLQPRRTFVNWLFGGFALCVSLWGLASLINSLNIEFFTPKTRFYFQINGLVLTVVSYCLFITFFGEFSPSVMTRMIIAGLLIGGLFTLSLWLGLVFRWEGQTWYVTPLGYAGLGLGSLYLILAYLLLRSVHNEKSDAVQLPTIILIIGLIGNYLPVLSRVPFDLIMASIAVIVLGRQVLLFQVFNPLEQLNHQLLANNQQLASEKEKVDQLNDHLQKANLYKSQFLANMSHELRTPLNSIIGYSDLLLGNIYGDLNEKQRDRLDKIHKNGKSLLALINDILDLSKIEAGQMVLNRQPVEILKTVESIKPVIEPLADSKQLKFILETPPAALCVFADELRLRQVFLNLISNAVKFTHEGHVTVRFYTHNPGNFFLEIPSNVTLGDGAWVIACVEDTGIGIAPEHQAVIFEEFRQADSSTTREYGGTGLGLSIVRHIIKMHDGYLWLKSDPGKGSQFYIALAAHP